MNRTRTVLMWAALVLVVMLAAVASAHAVGLADVTPRVPQSQCCCCVIPLGVSVVAAVGFTRRRRSPFA